jgi:hypothetical protein
MTTTEKTHRNLLALAKGSRFEGSLILDASGAPLAATDGFALVVLRCSTLGAAADAVEAGRAEDRPEAPLPPLRSLVTTLRGIAHDARYHEGSVIVGIDTEHDAAMRDAWLAGEVERLKLADARVASAEKALKEAKEAKRGGIGDARAKLVAARAEVRAILGRKLDVPFAHGFRVGPAVVDLRIVRRALKALGVRVGHLTATGEALDPVRLDTASGVGLVMPFRP